MPQAKKPAMTSGPGSMSRRTDGGPASKQATRYISGMPNYGDGQELQSLQASAPMEAAPQTPAGPEVTAQPQDQSQQAGPVDTSGLPGLTDPSARPWEHVTTPAILPQPVDPRQQENNALIGRYLPDLQAALNIPGVPDSYRKFVNYLSKQV